MKLQTKLAALTLMYILFFLARLSHAATLFDEAVLGDFSDDRLNPTDFVLSPGINSIKATSGYEQEPRDVEYVRVDLPPGTQLSQNEAKSQKARLHSPFNRMAIIFFKPL